MIISTSARHVAVHLHMDHSQPAGPAVAGDAHRPGSDADRQRQPRGHARQHNCKRKPPATAGGADPVSANLTLGADKEHERAIIRQVGTGVAGVCVDDPQPGSGQQPDEILAG